MHIILGIIGLATAAYFLIIRARNAAEMTHEVLDIARDVRSAARRFGFRRRMDVHPVDCIDDPQIAIGGLAVAFSELEDLPTAESRQKLSISLRKTLGISEEDSQEMSILGHWFVNECGGPTQAVTRLAKKLHKMQGVEGLTKSLTIIEGATSERGLSPRQTEALEEIRRQFRLS